MNKSDVIVLDKASHFFSDAAEHKWWKKKNWQSLHPAILVTASAALACNTTNTIVMSWLYRIRISLYCLRGNAFKTILCRTESVHKLRSIKYLPALWQAILNDKWCDLQEIKRKDDKAAQSSPLSPAYTPIVDIIGGRLQLALDVAHPPNTRVLVTYLLQRWLMWTLLILYGITEYRYGQCVLYETWQFQQYGTLLISCHNGKTSPFNARLETTGLDGNCQVLFYAIRVIIAQASWNGNQLIDRGHCDYWTMTCWLINHIVQDAE